MASGNAKVVQLTWFLTECQNHINLLVVGEYTTLHHDPLPWCNHVIHTCSFSGSLHCSM